MHLLKSKFSNVNKLFTMISVNSFYNKNKKKKKWYKKQELILIDEII